MFTQRQAHPIETQEKVEEREGEKKRDNIYTKTNTPNSSSQRSRTKKRDNKREGRKIRR